ncbi:MAG: hypothetical protein KatS3mg031_0085 [Chitinophagales bacterium]|nr:MAG: hypothetical protein KatS3mg031_0085 [Chitinophagales bacterium]
MAEDYQNISKGGWGYGMSVCHLGGALAGILLLFFIPLHAQDQSPGAIMPDQVPVRVEYYQIFLDKPVQKVSGVEYYDGSGLVRFKLSPDGRAIYLLDYNGSGGVKARIITKEGKTEEIIRSKCNIHSLQEL